METMEEKVTDTLRQLALRIKKEIEEGISSNILQPEEDIYFRWKVKEFEYSKEGVTKSSASGEYITKKSWMRATIKVVEDIKKSNEFFSALELLSNIFGKERISFALERFTQNPKLDFGGGINGFLIESVIATIEVKSTLTKLELENVIKAARNSKSLIKSVTQSFSTGYIPPAILNFVVAYDGPQNMSTVHGWITQIHGSLNISCPPLSTDPSQRISTPSPSIDGVFRSRCAQSASGCFTKTVYLSWRYEDGNLNLTWNNSYCHIYNCPFYIF